MKLVILSVGKLKNPLYKCEIEEYHRRINTFMPCEWETIRDIAGRKKTGTVIQEEGAGLLKRLGERDCFILLDESGEGRSSEGFSSWIFEMFRRTRGRLVMCVGGPFGVSVPVRERADFLLSLSPMTLPHEMCLLMLFEQLYRAITIEKGGNYHHKDPGRKNRTR